MAHSALGPRVLLRRLREVMAEPDTAQKRLDKIATLIAANMVAEVCSIYVMRPGQVLELYATEGLKRAAVHKSKLKVGEGLVGLFPAEGHELFLAGLAEKNVAPGDLPHGDVRDQRLSVRARNAKCEGARPGQRGTALGRGKAWRRRGRQGGGEPALGQPPDPVAEHPGGKAV